MKLCTSQTGIVLAVIPCFLYNQRLYCVLGKLIVILTVVKRLSAVTKQSA